MPYRLRVGDYVRTGNSIAGQIGSLSYDYKKAFVIFPIGSPHILNLSEIELVQKGTFSNFPWSLAVQYMQLLEKEWRVNDSL